MHTLYRFYDVNDVLLYVGITINPGRRMEKHRTTKAWWATVARIAMEQHTDQTSLLAAERAAIQTEKPLYNIRMNGGTALAAGASTSLAQPEGLVGRWFHSYDGEGTREWQGQILDREGDVFIAQLYSWWDGRASSQILCELEDMRRWKFYSSNEDMRIADGCSEHDHADCNAPVTHVIRDFFGMGAIYRCGKCIKYYAGTIEEL